MAVAQHRERGPVGRNQARAPFALLDAKRGHGRPRAHRQYFGKARILGIDDQPAVARHAAHEVMELTLDRGHVGENIGVVVFEIVENRDLRAVVHELAALVEECGVVFVRFDDKIIAAAQSCRDAEILRHAADEKSRRTAAGVEYPGQQRARRRLAVCAGDREYAARGEQALADPLRPGGIRQARIEHVLDGRVATRQRVADDHQVRHLLWIGAAQMLGAIAGLQRDAERGELIAHRRVDILVRTGDVMAQLARQCGDATHECAADAEDVQFHRATLMWRRARRRIRSISGRR